jgi:hypothetical protein
MIRMTTLPTELMSTLSSQCYLQVPAVAYKSFLLSISSSESTDATWIALAAPKTLKLHSISSSENTEAALAAPKTLKLHR